MPFSWAAAHDVAAVPPPAWCAGQHESNAQSFKNAPLLPTLMLWLNPALIPLVLCLSQPGSNYLRVSKVFSFSFYIRSAWFCVCPDKFLSCFLDTISRWACDIKCTPSKPKFAEEKTISILTPAWCSLDQNNYNPPQIHEGEIDLLGWAQWNEFMCSHTINQHSLRICLVYVCEGAFHSTKLLLPLSPWLVSLSSIPP